MLRANRGRIVLALAAAVSFAGAACDDHKSSPAASPAETDAAASRYTTADPKLEKALQAATAASGNANGPPPTGVFAAGVADQRHPRGTPGKVDLISNGSEPRISLAPADVAADSARASSYGPASVEVVMQVGPRTAMPVVDVGFVLGPAKKDEGGHDWLVAEVKKSVPAKEQLGALPPDADAEIRSLQGTQVRIALTPDGRESEVRTVLGPTTRPEVQRLAFGAAEALLVATVALPSEPVGVGAQWIAESRLPSSELDAITYRAYRVKAIDGDKIQLGVDLRAYATGPEAPLPGVPPGATLVEFESQGHADIELSRGEILARKLQLQRETALFLQPPGQVVGAPPLDPTQPPGAAGQAPGQGGGLLQAQMRDQAAFTRR